MERDPDAVRCALCNPARKLATAYSAAATRAAKLARVAAPDDPPTAIVAPRPTRSAIGEYSPACTKECTRAAAEATTSAPSPSAKPASPVQPHPTAASICRGTMGQAGSSEPETGTTTIRSTAPAAVSISPASQATGKAGRATKPRAHSRPTATSASRDLRDPSEREGPPNKQPAAAGTAKEGQVPTAIATTTTNMPLVSDESRSVGGTQSLPGEMSWPARLTPPMGQASNGAGEAAGA